MVFTALKDRLWKEMKGWKEKLLSRAGKEILIKSVIHAIPTYLMAVYRLPVSVIHDIQAMTAKFWWGNTDSKHKMHWINWGSLCTPKCLGGMGFRDIGIFNSALLGRQAWRLLKSPTSLLARVMSTKYYKNAEFLDSYLGTTSIFSWSSIWSSKSLIMDGTLWRIDNGSKFRIWEDSWVANDDGMYVTTPRIHGLSLVCDLLEGGEWSYNLLVQNFNDRYVTAILGIPLSGNPQEDN
ncbi:uncharacterized mitochondrial protein AtMg00310-like [Spinacia oleracea]|uniref:Uncharacterized mitochondrial protein AtMg00310-like n=1 Tax=Spinacia oleracea TaxID=3562 RepID=A0A9R0IM55_SPIOL|nr:uncharacterized mitochondrial protein AtMg00310-like [Spinacia oleracea]